MAIKKIFSFHVDPQTSDEQIRVILQGYPSDVNATPTGTYRKYDDILQIEMFLTTVSQENIYNTEAKLRGVISKITARTVLTAAELGPVAEGQKVPLPETSTSFKVLGVNVGSGSDVFGSFFDSFKDALSTFQALIVLGLLVYGAFLIIKFRK